ncbi:MAG: hypothetical protein LBF90_01660 [Prevotellaceae bacterium]|jgi:hypothetical protein|nr:hypothetical protein [Prevotellaceae bacterium]
MKGIDFIPVSDALFFPRQADLIGYATQRYPDWSIRTRPEISLPIFLLCPE